MTGKGNAVLWLGLVLILVNAYFSGQLKALWTPVSTGVKSGTGTKPLPANLTPKTVPNHQGTVNNG
jgi:hypothetical protein